MQEPHYVTSLRIELEQQIEDTERLAALLLAQSGVSEVNIIAEERGVYIKIDSKVTKRAEIEALIKEHWSLQQAI